MFNLFGQRKPKPLAELAIRENGYHVATFDADGLPGFALMDTALKEIQGHHELPIRLGIALRFLDRTDGDGLPSTAENQLLDELDDLYELLAAPKRRGFYAFRLTSRWVREWVCYITDAATGDEIAGRLQAKYPQYVVTHYTETDPKWEGYKYYVK